MSPGSASRDASAAVRERMRNGYRLQVKSTVVPAYPVDLDNTSVLKQALRRSGLSRVLAMLERGLQTGLSQAGRRFFDPAEIPVDFRLAIAEQPADFAFDPGGRRLPANEQCLVDPVHGLDAPRFVRAGEVDEPSPAVPAPAGDRFLCGGR